MRGKKGSKKKFFIYKIHHQIFYLKKKSEKNAKNSP